MTKNPLSVGLLAHVDAGKTTLSEALLYRSGVRRTLGRVDHGDAFLDTHDLERSRGITIFSKQAVLETATRVITLVDTPGHVDFSTEAERVLPILDCAVLVISATDGVQSHTRTLWKLLDRYGVPTFLFISKMDLSRQDKDTVLAALQENLSAGCVDFTAPDAQRNEAAALCDEGVLETFLETGDVAPQTIRELIARRRLFPCCFGSGLKAEGVDRLLEVLNDYAPAPTYPKDFGATVYKISRDPQGNRLTWLKVTGGSLSARDSISYVNQKGDTLTEKAVQLRLYSGEKFTPCQQVFPGQLCAVTGLSETRTGQGLGSQAALTPPLLEPVMTYRLQLPEGCDPHSAAPKLRQLEEEDPCLHLLMAGEQIHVQIMGSIQLEVLHSLILQRFSMDVTFSDPRIAYKETIAAPAVGIGHFEPLRHYAEVHLQLEPLPRGSGLVFDTQCSQDVLNGTYQRLILSHLSEKMHRGVLIGAPITDIKISLLTGKAHIKHTEGGDFREATYRAVRQGLMRAQSVLLEPWYQFILTVPTPQIGRAINDIRAMCGEFDGPETYGTDSTLTGIVPASEVGDYAAQVAAYTQGTGRLQLSLRGYAPCHNRDAVVQALSYNPEADLENTPDSVFCAHGAGFTVKWYDVENYMDITK